MRLTSPRGSVTISASSNVAALHGRNLALAKMTEDFLDPKSMLTPGVAGSLTVLITGTLASQFGLPGNWTGLILSFLFGLMVWANTAMPLVQRAIFYVLNSLVIFSVAIGINEAGVAATKTPEPRAIERVAPPPDEAAEEKFFRSWF